MILINAYKFKREYGENRFDEIEEGVDVTAWMPLPEPYREVKE